mgnify:CR=1 FL=1
MNLKALLGGMNIAGIISPMIKNWEKKIVEAIHKQQADQPDTKFWIKLKINKAGTKVIFENWATDKNGKNIYLNKNGYLADLIINELKAGEKNGNFENIDLDKLNELKSESEQ